MGVQCPNCKSSVLHHCPNFKCKWYRCNKCVPPMILALIFDLKGNKFNQRT